QSAGTVAYQLHVEGQSVLRPRKTLPGTVFGFGWSVIFNQCAMRDRQSPRRHPLHAAGGSVCGRLKVFWGGGPSDASRSAAATLDACRALLADHLSYGARWGLILVGGVSQDFEM
ncbi:unnamed protein product, partial [Pleuronectes platessa]